MSDRISDDQFNALLDKMILLGIITQGRDSKDGSTIYAPTKKFEEHLAQANEMLSFHKEKFALEISNLVEKTGSMEDARRSTMLAVIASYLELSEDDYVRRRAELLRYVDILYRLGLFMRLKRDLK